MVTLPGLRPIDEDRRSSEARGAKSRVQTPSSSNIRKPSLRPVASPVDTYARPEQAPIGSNGLEALAQSLASIQPSLQNFINVQDKAKNQPLDADYDAARTAMLGMSPDQRATAIKDGKVPALTTLAGREVAGERVAYDRSLAIMEAYNTSFDKGSGDIDAFVQEQIKGDLEQYGNDPVFMGAYSKQITAVTDRLKGQAVEDRSTFEMEKRTGDVYEKWSAKASFELAEGKAPEDIVKDTFSDFGKNRDLLRLPFDKQQEMVLQLADQAATRGDLALAKTYLQFERQDGPYKGSLLTDAKLGNKANDLLSRIDTAQQKLNLAKTAEEAEGQLGTELDEAWQRGEIKFRSPVTMPTKTGATKEVSPDDQEKQAAQRALDRSRQVAAERKETPEQTTERELEEFAANGVKQPEWFRVMDAGASAATVPNVSLDQPPDILIQGYQKYRELYGKAPVYLEQNLNSKAADFYEMVRVGEEMGWDQRLSMSVAMKASAPGAAQDEATQRAQFQKLNAKVADVVSSKKSGGLFGTGLFGTAPVNEGTVKTELNRYAQLYMKMGLGEDDAIEKASARFEKNYFNFNGTLIKRDERMPPNFESYAQTAVSAFVAKYGEQLHVDEGDLSLLQDGTSTGSWLIWNPSTGSTYPTSMFPEALVTYRSMSEAKQAERRKAEEAVVEKHSQRKGK
ncbi:hypothetical protein [Agrobacterium pusense]|uniref:Uncharacterized protein n=1 Tax=Agrobacterium pusense TaxID=648995 RepID=A0A6H0ZIC4_9HYPH|nr:hypothetical protein [Agrobacterium pusense]QIX20592.1 hypothetical protein FOB41_05285 [Agrobacterium pusense]WCK25345.1 hypothetical protein CFBP5496_0007150 [Agrobacterium pusense]